MQSIAERNDEFRKMMFIIAFFQDRCPNPHAKERVRIIQGVDALPKNDRAKVLLAVQNQTEFDSENDPHSEHDFGVIELEGIPKCYWKIDYYSDASLTYGTDDVENAYRVLTVMLASEY